MIAVRSVISTANCAPFCNSNPDARTSMALSCKAEIPKTFMSLNFTLVVTVAFASRHTLASVFSVGSALTRLIVVEKRQPVHWREEDGANTSTQHSSCARASDPRRWNQPATSCDTLVGQHRYHGGVQTSSSEA